MSEVTSKTIGGFEPGTVIELGCLGEVDTFESELTDCLPKEWWNPREPELENWPGRIALSTILQPADLHEPIKHIQLRVMEEPDASFDIANHAMQLYGRTFRRKVLYHNVHDNLLGFEFLADVVSTRKGKVAIITSQLYYGQIAESGIQHGDPVFRCVAMPRVAKEPKLDSSEVSKLIGQEVYRRSLARPYSAGLPH